MSRTERDAAGPRFRVGQAVAAAIAFAALVALGTWQLDRMSWKRDLIAAREARLALPPFVVGTAPVDPAALAFRRVRASGVFLHEKEILLGPRTRHGAAGYHVITPLRLAAGGIVLVDRGWVPNGRKDAARRRAGQVAGEVTVEGLARTPAARGRFTPDNVPAKGEWYSIDIAAMAAHLGLAGVKPFVIEAGPAPNPGGLPVGGGTIVRPPDNHLQYALTWYALAAALAVIYVLHRRRPRGG